MPHSDDLHATAKALKAISNEYRKLRSQKTDMLPLETLRNCLMIQLLLSVVIYTQYCHSSSIYVGRHASGTRLEQQQIYKGCEDFDARKCQKIIGWYGKDSCDTNKYTWARSLIRICPGSCGLCECKDNLGRFCLTLSQHCNSQGDTGKFLQQNCPKTCNTCHMSRGNSELGMIGL